MSKSEPQSICLLRLSAIGDTCNVVPAILQLQQAFPAVQITWVIGRVEHTLLEHLPGVEFIIVDKSAGKKGHRQVKQQLQNRSFDVLLHMHASMRANLISRSIDASRRIGFDRRRARDFQFLFCNERIAPSPRSHVVDGFLGFIETLGIDRTKPIWDIPISHDAHQFGAQHIHRPTLIVSPCSSDRRKNFRNWSVENYRRVIKHAIDRHQLDVILTGGNTPKEAHYGQQIEKDLNLPIKNLIGQTTLQQLMALVTRAQIVLCPDSGPAHMANAGGTPVIGLFATSNRKRTGPYNSQNWIADRYPDALIKYLHKDIDHVRWGQRVRAPEAMDLITVDEVTSKLDLLMKQLKLPLM